MRDGKMQINLVNKDGAIVRSVQDHELTEALMMATVIEHEKRYYLFNPGNSLRDLCFEEINEPAHL